MNRDEPTDQPPAKRTKRALPAEAAAAISPPSSKVPKLVNNVFSEDTMLLYYMIVASGIKVDTKVLASILELKPPASRMRVSRLMEKIKRSLPAVSEAKKEADKTAEVKEADGNKSDNAKVIEEDGGSDSTIKAEE
ncbi:unnamed protein product [Penicillium bialowiezense]